MPSRYSRLLTIGFRVLGACLVCCSVALPKEATSERERVLAALTLSYGVPFGEGKPLFVAAPDYVLAPVFSANDLLIEISIQPKSNNLGEKPQPPMPLSRPEFEFILANINSIKPLGAFEEDSPWKFMHGGRAWGIVRYQKAYLQTAEPITDVPPRPIAFAYIYYLHPVTGIATISGDTKPADAGSFGLVCVNGESYIAPKTGFLTLQSNPFQRQTVDLAGPTEANCGKLP